MLQRQTADNGVVYYWSPLLGAVGAPHGFSTRIGGVSPGSFASLNLGNPANGEQDSQAHIDENLRRFLAAIGCTGRQVISARQVHGTSVADVRHLPHPCEADGLISDDPDRAVSVRTADCVPILLSDDRGRTVAAVHAGWRGVVKGVAPSAVAALRRRMGRAALLAAVGPCIGGEAFEVGPEVLDQFERRFGPSSSFIRRRNDGKGHVDLSAAVHRQLLESGLSADSIDGADCCTFRDRHEFYSHRRDCGKTGRLLAVIAPGAGAAA